MGKISEIVDKLKKQTLNNRSQNDLDSSSESEQDSSDDGKMDDSDDDNIESVLLTSPSKSRGGKILGNFLEQFWKMVHCEIW